MLKLGKRLMDESGAGHLADILMGAAHADGTLDTIEVRKIREVLQKASWGNLSDSLLDRLIQFDIRTFDLASSCEGLGALNEEERRELFKLIQRVTEADDVHDLDESAYICRVAKLISATPEEYEQFVLEIVDIEPMGPPPLPPLPNGDDSKD